jgi:hypothetical protein
VRAAVAEGRADRSGRRGGYGPPGTPDPPGTSDPGTGTRQARRTRPRAAPVQRRRERPECSRARPRAACPATSTGGSAQFRFRQERAHPTVKPRRRSGHDGLSRTLRDLPRSPGGGTRGARRRRARVPCARMTTDDRERTRPMVTMALLTTGEVHTICAMAGTAA